MWGTFNIRDYYSPKIDKQINSNKTVGNYLYKKKVMLIVRLHCMFYIPVGRAQTTISS